MQKALHILGNLSTKSKYNFNKIKRNSLNYALLGCFSLHLEQALKQHFPIKAHSNKHNMMHYKTAKCLE